MPGRPTKRRGGRRWGYDSRGTPALVHLPGCLTIALLCFLPLLAPDLVERCTGLVPPESPGRKGAAAVHAALATLCSPLLLLGPAREQLLALTLIALIMAALWARHWMKQHQAHWDMIRAQEREKRAERRAAIKNQEEPPAGRG